MESLKRKCILIKEFEQLKNEDNLYSFRISTKNNIRIIFVFLKIIGSEKAVFLNAFQEKNTKDYQLAIKIARNRELEILNAVEREERKK